MKLSVLLQGRYIFALHVCVCVFIYLFIYLGWVRLGWVVWLGLGFIFFHLFFFFFSFHFVKADRNCFDKVEILNPLAEVTVLTFKLAHSLGLEYYCVFSKFWKEVKAVH